MQKPQIEPLVAPEAEGAPSYPIPSRTLTAIEHPLIIKDLEKGIKTFGQTPAYSAILESSVPQLTVPLYLRYDNPTVRPLPSYNAPTHNVLLKVTVPKRTGRKRKRGSNNPFEEDPVANTRQASASPSDVQSMCLLDDPVVLRRKLCDNVGKYVVEPVGLIQRTHRYRGFTDFQYAMGQSKFMNEFVGKVLPGDVSKIREFAVKPGIERHAMVDIVPPPFFTAMTLPFPYHYSQNVYTKQVEHRKTAEGHNSEDEEFGHVVNVTSRAPAVGYFLRQNEYPAPLAPQTEPDMTDPQVAMIIQEMRQAMDERPIWTRRSMWNRLAAKFETIEDPRKGALGPRSGALIKHCLPFVGYQFKGGPWRDAMVRYGVDPRSDPKYRIYQTLIFKLHKTRVGTIGRSWHSVRTDEIAVKNYGKFWAHKLKSSSPRDTHMFDGQSFHTDGKVWQVCDVTDSLLKRLFEQVEPLAKMDPESGWFSRVVWAVAKAVMKSKMLGIRFKRDLTDEDYRNTVGPPEEPKDGKEGANAKASISLSLPSLNLDSAELDVIRSARLRPGPANLRRARDDDRGRVKKAGYTHRQRLRIEDDERRDVAKMIELFNGPSNAVSGQAAEAPQPQTRIQDAVEANEDERDDDEQSIESFLGDMEEDDSGSDILEETGDEDGEEDEEDEEDEDEDNLDEEDDGGEDEEGEEEDEDAELDEEADLDNGGYPDIWSSMGGSLHNAEPTPSEMDEEDWEE